MIGYDPAPLVKDVIEAHDGRNTGAGFFCHRRNTWIFSLI